MTFNKGVIVFDRRKKEREWEAEEAGISFILTSREDDGGYTGYIFTDRRLRGEDGEERELEEVKKIEEDSDTIICNIPSVSALYSFVDIIFHKFPRFGSTEAEIESYRIASKVLRSSL
tara:strand:+ start:498 stop:851 length:354 start_codon:yes stop_codon:yes gene_type:complete